MTLKPKQNSSGHILVYKPDHSSSYKSGTRKGYIYEHRYIAELNLGRPLLEGEVVHHLDGNPGNNSWENLLVLSSKDFMSGLRKVASLWKHVKLTG